MKAINNPTSKALRILDNIMKGYAEWFAKDEHHSASLEYSRVGGDYEIITAKFYGTGAKVRKLNFTDIDDALGYLAHNHYYNVAAYPTDEEPAEEPATTEPASPFADLIGRKLHTYDSWNGSSCCITIEEAEQEPTRIQFGEFLQDGHDRSDAEANAPRQFREILALPAHAIREDRRSTADILDEQTQALVH